MTNPEYRERALSLLEMLNERQRALQLSDKRIADATGIGRTTLLRCRNGNGLNLATAIAWAASMGLSINLQSGQNVMPVTPDRG